MDYYCMDNWIIDCVSSTWLCAPFLSQYDLSNLSPQFRQFRLQHADLLNGLIVGHR